ncbi:hypothetical protein [Pseudomonas piscis]|uniref:Uncharacterized protein n=1 Tax=Pseudomonas piscis TaxID=2614538 RepID=A0A7X1U718_9PSED|nr:hypothetical protein [Pseudomonas piscis]MQA56790.1 hypothetical protein [Pseudomonas piscis]
MSTMITIKMGVISMLNEDLDKATNPAGTTAITVSSNAAKAEFRALLTQRDEFKARTSTLIGELQ